MRLSNNVYNTQVIEVMREIFRYVTVSGHSIDTLFEISSAELALIFEHPSHDRYSLDESIGSIQQSVMGFQSKFLN